MLEEFVYHPTEERIYKKVVYDSAGAVKETITYFTADFVRISNSSGTFDTTYIMHEGQKVAEVRYDGAKQFMHDDHLGSTGAITDSSGLVVEQTTYSPFGEIVGGGAVSRYDYEGKEYDSLVGDYDFNFRKYCVKFGIFCQPDTLIQNVYDPQSLNRYMFERGNPYKNVDPTGHCIWDLCSLETAAIVYVVLETAADVVSLSISIIDVVDDPHNQDNRIALYLDILDTLSGPISNPGLSGSMYRYWKALEETKKGVSKARFIEGAREDLDEKEDKGDVSEDGLKSYSTKKRIDDFKPQQQEAGVKNKETEQATGGSSGKSGRGGFGPENALYRFWNKVRTYFKSPSKSSSSSSSSSSSQNNN